MAHNVFRGSIWTDDSEADCAEFNPKHLDEIRRSIRPHNPSAKNILKFLIFSDSLSKELKEELNALGFSYFEIFVNERFRIEDRQQATKQLRPYKFKEYVGQGASGYYCFRALDEDNRREVFIKMYRLIDATTEEQFRNEAKLLKRLKSDFVVEILGDAKFVGSSTGIIVMEYISFGSLLTWIEQFPDSSVLNKEEDTGKVFSVIYGLLECVDHLHMLNIVHHDLKPTNILRSEPSRVKVADFGESKPVACSTAIGEDTMTAMTMKESKASARYAAPELLMQMRSRVGRSLGGDSTLARQDVGSKATDIWAVALVIVDLLAGTQMDRLTPANFTEQKHCDDYLTEIETLLTTGRKCESDKDALMFLLRGALRFEPDSRMTADELLWTARHFRERSEFVKMADVKELFPLEQQGSMRSRLQDFRRLNTALSGDAPAGWTSSADEALARSLVDETKAVFQSTCQKLRTQLTLEDRQQLGRLAGKEDKSFDSVQRTIVQDLEVANDPQGFEAFQKEIEAVVSRLVGRTSDKQPEAQKEIEVLIGAAVKTRPAFIKVVNEVAERGGGKAEIASIKSLQRILEKACSFKGDQFHFNLDDAKDNNRAKVKCKSIAKMRSCFRRLAQLDPRVRGAGGGLSGACSADDPPDISIVKIKNRLVGKVDRNGKRTPSLGDCLIHFFVEVDGVEHICEVQLVLESVEVVRNNLGGHNAYTWTRSAQAWLKALDELQGPLDLDPDPDPGDLSEAELKLRLNSALDDIAALETRMRELQRRPPRTLGCADEDNHYFIDSTMEDVGLLGLLRDMKINCRTIKLRFPAVLLAALEGRSAQVAGTGLWAVYNLCSSTDNPHRAHNCKCLGVAGAAEVIVSLLQQRLSLGAGNGDEESMESDVARWGAGAMYWMSHHHVPNKELFRQAGAVALLSSICSRQSHASSDAKDQANAALEMLKFEEEQQMQTHA